MTGILLWRSLVLVSTGWTKFMSQVCAGLHTSSIVTKGEKTEAELSRRSASRALLATGRFCLKLMEGGARSSVYAVVRTST